ncbi:MAG: hypothetical protein U0930_22020 [Pirellulales bacterium]
MSQLRRYVYWIPPAFFDFGNGTLPMASQHQHHQPSSYLCWLLVVGAILWSLRGLLLKDQIPAFRDGFHFYWPQLVWLDKAYQAGDYFPNWNPNEGLGSSVSAQPTWQIYYPARVLFLLPVLSLPQKLGLFVLLHLLLSVWGMLRAARALDLSATAAWLSAIAFSLSCPVLFQVNNLIYLCSATWVAWSLSAIVSLMNFTRQGLMPQAIYTMVACGSMMTVCGDPHGAVNLALVAVAATVVGFCRRRFSNELRVNQSTPNSSRTLRTVHICTLLAIALAGIQTYQSSQWFRISSRSNSAVQAIDSFHPRIQQILAESPEVQSRNTFDFSLSPWNFSTLVWPTINGHFQPENSRWVQAIPSESRMWIPSMYVGLIPFILTSWGLFRCRSNLQTWLLLFCGLSLLLTMGNYSLGWLLRNLVGSSSGTQLASWLPCDNQLSLYGLLVQFLPGYDSFRYPAKWIVWFTSFVALLAGVNADRLLNLRSPSVQRHRASNNQGSIVPEVGLKSFSYRVGLIAAISLVVLIVVIVGYSMTEVRGRVGAWLDSSYDRLAGQADLHSSFLAILRGLVQTLIVCAIAIWACKHLAVGPRRSNKRL